MNRASFSEDIVEQAALAWLEGLNWRVAYGPDIAPETAHFERDNYGEVVIARRLRNTLAQINPSLPAYALEDAFRKLTHPEGATPEARNRAFHRMLINGVAVEYRGR